MGGTIRIQTPLDEAAARALRAGDMVSISGLAYTARDAAHLRFRELLQAGEPLPFDLEGGIIYYCGPAPAPPGRPIGSAGPTTSGRMDVFTPELIEKTGLRGMIGKGSRSPEVVGAMRRFGCVYFAAVGGAAALLANHIAAAEVVAYEDLGAEAPRRIALRDFPAVVAIDTHGGNLYEAAMDS